MDSGAPQSKTKEKAGSRPNKEDLRDHEDNNSIGQ